jgi:hypothetical protein
MSVNLILNFQNHICGYAIQSCLTYNKEEPWTPPPPSTFKVNFDSMMSESQKSKLQLFIEITKQTSSLFELGL